MVRGYGSATVPATASAAAPIGAGRESPTIPAHEGFLRRRASRQRLRTRASEPSSRPPRHSPACARETSRSAGSTSSRSLDGIEPGLWALGRLGELGVTVLNGRPALVKAHDKLETAAALARCRSACIREPSRSRRGCRTPELEPPLVLKPRFGSWGLDVVRCDDVRRDRVALWPQLFARVAGSRRRAASPRDWSNLAGFDLRVVVCAWQLSSAPCRRVAAARRMAHERRPRRHGASRCAPPDDACALALRRGRRDRRRPCVGVDLLPDGAGGWVVHRGERRGRLHERVLARRRRVRHRALGPARGRADSRSGRGLALPFTGSTICPCGYGLRGVRMRSPSRRSALRGWQVAYRRILPPAELDALPIDATRSARPSGIASGRLGRSFVDRAQLA